MQVHTYAKFLSVVLIGMLLTMGCATNPITGRKSLNILPASQMNAMALTEYQKFLSTSQVNNTSRKGEMVREIGVNIQKATEKYYAENNISDQLEKFDWSFNLVEENTVNAWCMPGGRVVVYSGILPVCRNTDGLAVVMGHEIAHALGKHGNERMSQGLVTQLGGVALQVAMKDKPAATQQIFNTAYGVGSQVAVLLPFSRKHESEADEMGLYLMAMAGYDPTEAAPFWLRMKAGGGQSPPEFMSTHPDPEKRSVRLQQLVPKAKEYASKHGGQKKHPKENF
ncbi:MAG: M48 family metallopeptidase [Bacteroidia bacterium]